MINIAVEITHIILHFPLFIMQTIILGSQSPRRQALIHELGLPFEVMVRPTAENIPPNLPPIEVVEAIAREKAEAFSDLANDYLIITADTIVVCEGQILGKPQDDKEAFEMLSLLSDKAHEVMTGVCIYKEGKIHAFVETTKVYFRALTEQEIWHYIHTHKPFDKAGAYGVQEGIGVIGITKIEGDFYNVMGLPVCRLHYELNKLAAI
jgi:septum formation protein